MVPIRRVRRLDVTWHRTPAGIVEEYCGDAHSSTPMFIGDAWGVVAPRELLRRVRKQGTWGFARRKRGGATIHLWARRGTSLKRLHALIFHEYLHGVVILSGRRAHAAMEPIEAVAEVAFSGALKAHRRQSTRKR